MFILAVLFKRSPKLSNLFVVTWVALCVSEFLALHHSISLHLACWSYYYHYRLVAHSFICEDRERKKARACSRETAHDLRGWESKWPCQLSCLPLLLVSCPNQHHCCLAPLLITWLGWPSHTKAPCQFARVRTWASTQAVTFEGTWTLLVYFSSHICLGREHCRALLLSRG